MFPTGPASNFGIHGGGGWDHASFDVPGLTSITATAMLDSTFPDASPKGGIFGGHAGYNWQYGPIVGGVEVDFSGADIKDSSIFFVGGDAFNREIKVEELASARGRLGYALLHNLLAFGTAGIGWGHTRLTVTDPSVPGATGSTFVNEFGWVAGAGLEYRLFEHLLLRAEYLH
jgi:opacity protein-like surface antigen